MFDIQTPNKVRLQAEQSQPRMVPKREKYRVVHKQQDISVLRNKLRHI